VEAAAVEVYSGPTTSASVTEVPAMFGTVARMKFKPGSFEKMQDLMKGFEERQVEGFLFNAVYRSQSDPDEVWFIVGFEDEASYRANANDPQTDQMAQQSQELMAAPPEWHDGEIVSMTRAEDRASTQGSGETPA
jgi:quinol monooxygenase YgiN